ncbi:MAG: hypothetical protein ABJC24_01010, partial [Chloroflexota bacterium]
MPAHGERDLALDRIQASFRYCVGCRLLVGRTCCWNPDAVACIVDAPAFALSATLLSDATPEGSSNELTARRGLAELAASLDAVEHVDGLTGLTLQTRDDREVGRTAWDDAWLAMGWLIVRADSSRDVAAKALRNVPAYPGPSTTEDLAGQLTGLDEQYGRARATIEARMVAAGKSLARRERRRPFPGPRRRLEPTVIGIGVLGAVGVLAFAAAALLQLGYLDPFASNRDAVASHPDGDVLGGGGGPGPSHSPGSDAAPPDPDAVIARLDFDELRVGQLAAASKDIGPVVGDPEVVAFPSPFDRSIRVDGDAPHRFCMPIANLGDGPVSFEIDLYAETPITSGRLKLSVAPSGVGPTSASVPLKLLDGLTLQAWHRLRAAWTPRQRVAIGDAGLGHMQTTTVPAAHDARAV